MRRCFLAAIVLCSALSVRGEDATKPDDTFALSLIHWLTIDQSQPPTVADRAVAHTFDRATRLAASEMACRFSGARVLASASYTGKPTTLASDVSRQLRSIDDIPSENLAPLLVDPAKTDRANAVAGEWAMSSLQADPTDTIGALVLWHADEHAHSLLDGATPRPHLVLVLFRATGDASRGYQLQRLAWGDIDR